MHIAHDADSISLIIYIYMMNKRKQGDDKTVLK